MMFKVAWNDLSCLLEKWLHLLIIDEGATNNSCEQRRRRNCKVINRRYWLLHMEKRAGLFGGCIRHLHTQPLFFPLLFLFPPPKTAVFFSTFALFFPVGKCRPFHLKQQEEFRPEPRKKSSWEGGGMTRTHHVHTIRDPCLTRTLCQRVVVYSSSR